MTVIVDYDKNGNAIFRSVKGLGSSEEEREQAYKLDKLIQKEINKLDNRLKTSKKLSASKYKVETYWKFGDVLRKIFYESKLISPSEKMLFWLNVKLRSPKYLLAEDRGPNRIHVEYCFRLAGYPKKIALKREWSEWVYLFDSPFINKESRFDKWDHLIIEKEPNNINRENTRLFIQCLNSMLNKVETNELKEDELFRCYDAAWLLTINFSATTKSNDRKDYKLTLKKVISERKNYVGKLIEGSLKPTDFASIIYNQFPIISK